MFSSLINWRTNIALIAIAIIIGTIFYSNFLSKKIAADEKQRVEQWVQAVSEISNPAISSTNLASKILTENSIGIPMITVTETDSILDYYNIDTQKIIKNKNYIKEKLKEFKKTYPPIIWKNPYDSNQINLVYYGETDLLKEIKYFPIVQLIIVALFIFITLVAVSTKNKSTQNQVWAGMAKETAHQLGTPISSLEGWIEMLKESTIHQQITTEISKDVERLKLVSDRFGKIGSIPQLETADIILQIYNMVQYIKGRSSDKVDISMHSNEKEITASINPNLFDWVIENLLKNALDAIEGKGQIDIDIRDEKMQIIIDVKDNGKGISKKNIPNVLKPGFTTKKRGWGLGLSLSKRIIEQYHKGQLFVKSSDIQRGTTFRIILKK